MHWQEAVAKSVVKEAYRTDSGGRFMGMFINQMGRGYVIEKSGQIRYCGGDVLYGYDDWVPLQSWGAENE